MSPKTRTARLAICVKQIINVYMSIAQYDMPRAAARVKSCVLCLCNYIAVLWLHFRRLAWSPRVIKRKLSARHGRLEFILVKHNPPDARPRSAQRLPQAAQYSGKVSSNGSARKRAWHLATLNARACARVAVDMPCDQRCGRGPVRLA
jgi:hypothetical protein